MTPLAIARSRPTSDPAVFLMAYTAATQAPRWDLDVEALVAAALRDDNYPKIAGLLEGTAALNAAAGMPREAAPITRGRLAAPHPLPEETAA